MKFIQSDTCRYFYTWWRRRASRTPDSRRVDAHHQVGECKLWDLGAQNVLSNNFIFLGRGFNYPIALEGAMKCKEIAYIHAEGHAPVAVDLGVVCIAISAQATSARERT